MYLKARYLLILAFGACLCATCQQSPISSPASFTPARESSAAPQPDADIEEYAVYNDLLESRFKGDELDQVLIIDHTDANHPALLEQDLEAFQEDTALSPELVASFIERNQQSHPIKSVLDFGMEYQLLSQEEVDELRPTDEASGWNLLYEKYPNAYGFVCLSRAGFNADFSQALVYMSTYHYERPIEGSYYLMTRQDGRWVIESSYGWNA